MSVNLSANNVINTSSSNRNRTAWTGQKKKIYKDGNNIDNITIPIITILPQAASS